MGDGSLPPVPHAVFLYVCPSLCTYMCPFLCTCPAFLFLRGYWSDCFGTHPKDLISLNHLLKDPEVQDQNDDMWLAGHYLVRSRELGCPEVISGS